VAVDKTVSVVVPCYNEQRTILKLLDALSRQTYPLEQMEVIIADGMSTDKTRELVGAFIGRGGPLSVRLIDNPARSIPAALNLAINAARGRVVVRLDAHSVPSADYIERCLEVLQETGAANVGGVWDIRPSSDHWIARSIAVAGAHPFGAGDARYRTRGKPGEADTVPFGAFQKAWLDRVGPFDETLLSNEDYQYNYRLRQAGGKIWFDPRIRSVYFARHSLRALARQYARYGYWKAQMLKRHPESLRWRQALPALFTPLLIVLALGAWFSPLFRVALGLYMGVYLTLTLGAGLVEAVRRRDAPLALGVPLAFWTMHVMWGLGFSLGLIHSPAGEQHGGG
jgi:glycosyltransferase involved in cell wall biosynthesis